MIKYFRVSGRVQGVGFRASTLNEGQRLGVAGWVRNCSDGSVEALAEGNIDQLQLFENWLNSGPRLSRVEHVSVIELTEDHPSYQSYTRNLTHQFIISY